MLQTMRLSSWPEVSFSHESNLAATFCPLVQLIVIYWSHFWYDVSTNWLIWDCKSRMLFVTKGQITGKHWMDFVSKKINHICARCEQSLCPIWPTPSSQERSYTKLDIDRSNWRFMNFSSLMQRTAFELRQGWQKDTSTFQHLPSWRSVMLLKWSHIV